MADRKFIAYRDFPAKGIRYSLAQINRLRKLPADNPRRFPDPVRGLGKENFFLEVEIDEYIERQLAAARRTAA